MGHILERIKSLASKTVTASGKPEPVLIARLALAAVLAVVTVFVKLPAAVRIVLLVLSLIIAGFDIVVDAVQAVLKKDFFAAPVVIVLVALVGSIIGFVGECAAYVLIYQCAMVALRYAQARTKQSALELVKGEDEERAARVRELVNAEESGKTVLESVIGRSASIVLKAAMLFAVIYAIVVPFTGPSFRASIHRALMILAVCTPLSVVAAMPLTAIVGQCFAAAQGILFNKASNMEDAAHTETAVFDKAGIFSEEAPKLLAVRSDMLDKDTMMNFAAHALYYSEQPLAKAVSDAYEHEYRLDVISDFTEIPGCGVQVKIAGNPVVLASKDYLLSRGVRLPLEQEPGQVFYLVIADRYVGKVIISASTNEAAKNLAEEMRDAGVNRCILLTEDGAEQSQRIGEALKFDEVYGECDTEKKLSILSDMSNNTENSLLYVYSNGFEAHSAADVDMRVSKKAKFADASVDPDRVANLPFAIQISKRMGQVQTENAIFAFLIKALLIFLAINGKCTIWFAAFLDMAATLATVLNAIRVTQDSLLSKLRRSE